MQRVAELAIIATAAVIAPLVVFLAVAIARSAGVIAPVRRQTPQTPPAVRRHSPVRSSNLPDPVNIKGGEPNDVRFCQACGRSTSASASYCRSCGAQLDKT